MTGRVDPPVPGRARGADPLGTRALFAPPAAGGGDVADGATGSGSGPVGDPFAPSPAEGRRALFSSAGDDVGPDEASPTGVGATVVCRSCRARTALGPVALVSRLIPSLWIPGRRWSRLLRCPACGRPAWCRVEWGRTA